MYHLKDLHLAIRIADLQSISAAGRELGMTPAAASAALQRLEKLINCQLFSRSTRSMTLTQEGQVFIETGRKALELLEGANTALADNRGELKGEIRIALPSDLGRNLIRGWLDDFANQAPDLTLTLLFGDHMSDLINQNLHLALRYGQLEDSNLKRRQLAMTHRVAIASPDYLAKSGIPKHPNELNQHQILLLNRGGKPWNKWRFSHKGESYDTHVRANKISNDGAVIRDWALAGEGIAYKSWLDVAADVHQGRLVLLFPDQLAEKIPLQLVYLQSDYPTLKIRKTIDFIIKRIEEFSETFPLIVK
ncbi:LysR family transcriptional regulator [Shewanella eurypsychrophilus]|uniref:LysR family transcriptional regulator n=1 Tax=Shewanella eurypsychrophilus TaxID=2593656 RepID=A0ABX6V4K3_9GAMM|nr:MULTISPECIES: LysR family transcriptional regulator [Shewanella]QFU21196.1 LysR family transcriptional regulator [Shewanella sp. YLB-09]QPG56487.1 LysR family transcriptional regulator [Shewanella eurypsychrophilus]